VLAELCLNIDGHRTRSLATDLQRLNHAIAAYPQLHNLTTLSVAMNTKPVSQFSQYTIIPNIIPTRTRSMSLKQLNVKIPEQELRILEAFADKTERTKTDIIREFIRSLQAKI
jgi:Ribbon-helix-helix protein, copG family